MLRERARVVDGVLRALDLAAVAASFPIAYAVRDGIFGEKIGWPGLYPFARYRPLLVLALVGWLAASSLLRLYQAHRMPTAGVEIRRAARALAALAAALAAVGFLAKDASVSRLFILFYFGVTLAVLTANRLLLRRALRVLRDRGFTTRIAAVVGTSDLARQVGEAIASRPEWGYHLAGYVEEDGCAGPHRVGPVLGSVFPHGGTLVERLQHLLDKKVLDEVIFAVPQERLKDIEAAVALCRREGVTARIRLDVDPAGSRLSIEDVAGVPLLGFYEA